MKHLIALVLSFGLLAFGFSQEYGAISGVVTDSVSGNPIAGANVCAMTRHGGGRAVTNQNGEYVIQNLRPGYYRVTASAPNYFPKHYPDSVLVVDGQTTPNINFALAPYELPQRGGISGIVTDSITGNPIAGANVSACGPSCGHAVTNQNGEYLIENLLPGDYRVNASARGYLTKHYPERVRVEPNQITPNINFALAPHQPPPPRERGSISGMVTDETTGEPIAGAMVIARGMRRRIFGRAMTRQDGTYTIENLMPGEYRVTASARGYHHETYPELVIVYPRQNTPDINFALTPHGEERGKKDIIEGRGNKGMKSIE